jgi:PAN domain
MRASTCCIQAPLFAATALLALVVNWPVLAQQSVYSYTLPSGWTRSIEGDVETLTPAAEPAGSAQAMLFAPKALGQDFETQFNSERSALEASWGLSAPMPVSPQSGRTKAGPYAAYFASYESEGGARYMSFLAIGRPQGFAMMVFVAASDDAFNRVAPQATQLWQNLELAATNAPTAAVPPAPATPPAPGTAAMQPPAPVPAQPAQAGAMEHDTDRLGNDMYGFNVAQADPAMCQAACMVNGQCAAWTYVKPGIKGPLPRCYLKSAAPTPSPDTCCVSGVKAAMSTPRARR